MKIFRGIVGILMSVYMWIWIINNSFKGQKKSTKSALLIFLVSIFAVLFLYFYKDILATVGLGELSLTENITTKAVFSFIFYCVSFLVLVALFFGNLKKKSNLKFIVVALLLFVGIGIGGLLAGINTMIIYYLVSCYAEEIVKFSTGGNVLQVYEQKDQTSEKKGFGNLVLFSILAGLGFSVVENILYLVVLSIGGEMSIFTTLSRSIFTTLLHIVATGIIAFFIIKKDKLKAQYRLKCLVGIVCGFALHALYNLSLNYNYKILTILILIVCYFILTYLLFNSDLIYKSDSNKK